MVMETMLNVQCFPWTGLTLLPVLLYLLLQSSEDDEAHAQSSKTRDEAAKRFNQRLSRIDNLFKVFLVAYTISIVRDIVKYCNNQVTIDEQRTSFPHISATTNGMWTMEFISDITLVHSVNLTRNIFVLLLWRIFGV